MKKLFFLLFFLLPILSLEASTVTLTEADVPHVCKGASTAFDSAYLQVSQAFVDFYYSDIFRYLSYVGFTFCVLIGLCYKAGGLMIGTEELEQFGWWAFWRFLLGFTLFFNAINLTEDLVGYINGVSDDVAQIVNRKEDPGLIPGLEARFYLLSEENDVWLRAVEETLGTKIEAEIQENYGHWFEGRPNSALQAGYYGTLNYGFPLLNYGIKLPTDAKDYKVVVGSSNLIEEDFFTGTFRYNKNQYLYKGALPKVPYFGYLNPFGLYAADGVTDNRLTPAVFGKSPVMFQSRPYTDALLNNTDEIYKQAQQFDLDSTPEEVSKFTTQHLLIHKFKIQSIRNAYLADYVGWLAQGSDSIVRYNLGDDLGFWRSWWKTRKTKHGDNKALSAVVADVQESMDRIRSGRDKFGNGIMGALIPLALGIVGFYVTVTAWSLPILITVWSCFFFLPEPLGLGEAMKKGVTLFVTLLAIPVFATLIVEVGLAFVHGVQLASTQNGMEMISTYITGAVAAKLMPGSGMLGCLSAAAGAGGMMFTSTFSDINIFVIAAWIVAFLFILSTPKICHEVVSGTGGFASGLLQKAGVGGAVAGMGMGMAASTLNQQSKMALGTAGGALKGASQAAMLSGGGVGETAKNAGVGAILGASNGLRKAAGLGTKSGIDGLSRYL